VSAVSEEVKEVHIDKSDEEEKSINELRPEKVLN
jgi:hypothetical protein